MKPSEALALHHSAIRQVVASHRARNVRVFGSVLHGEDSETSDLDLLIDTTPHTTLMDVAAIQVELERLLGVSVDVLTPGALPGTGRGRTGMKATRVADYLGHILQAIARIDRYIADVDEVGFLENELLQDAVLRNIEIVGEAANNIERVAPAFAARHNDIPWQVMVTMRNRIAHGYDKVDLEIVWRTLQQDLPTLYRQIQTLAAQMAVQPDPSFPH